MGNGQWFVDHFWTSGKPTFGSRLEEVGITQDLALMMKRDFYPDVDDALFVNKLEKMDKEFVAKLGSLDPELVGKLLEFSGNKLEEMDKEFVAKLGSLDPEFVGKLLEIAYEKFVRLNKKWHPPFPEFHFHGSAQGDGRWWF